MSDVPFRLTVTRDPNAKSTIRQWEKDLVKADETYNRKKVDNRRKSEVDINGIRGKAVQAEIRAQKAAEESARASLARRLVAYKKEKAAEVEEARKAAEKIQAQEARGVRRPAGGGGGSGGGAGPGGGVGAGAAGGLLSRVGVGAAARIGGPVALAYGAYRFGRTGVQNYSEQEAKIARLGSMVGSEGRARGIYDEMKGLTAVSGADTDGLIEAVQMMVNFGVEVKEATKKARQMVAIAGGDINRVSALARGYGQASSMGRLQAEERNQLIDAGFNPMQEIAASTGMAMGDLTDKMRKGELSADLLSQAFDTATAAGGRFGGVMESMEGTTKQVMASFGQSWKAATIDIGRRLAPAVDVVAGAAGSLLNTVVRLGEMGDFAHGGKDADRAINAATANNLDAARYHMASGLTSETARTTEVANAIKSLELDKEIAEVHDRLQARLTAAESRREAAEKRELSNAKNLVATRSKLVANAHEVNKVRQKGAEDELKSSQKLLASHQKIAAEARGALMSSREKFGSMSTEDQRTLVQTILKGRKDHRSLGVEDISRLQSFGSAESNRLASAAAIYRSRGAFGSTAAGQIQQNLAQQGAAKDASRRVSERANWQYDSEGNQLNERMLTRSDRARQEQLRWQGYHLNNQRRNIQEQDQRRTQIRESIFGEERQAARQATARMTRVEANVSHNIEFVAKFEQNAEQIANKVIGLYDEANRKEMAKIEKMLAPIVKAHEDRRRKNMALNPGRGRNGGR